MGASDQQGEGPVKVAVVTFDLTMTTPNERHIRRSRWAEEGGGTFSNTHILASDHQQLVSSNWAHGDDTAILDRKLRLGSGRTICYPGARHSAANGFHRLLGLPAGQQMYERQPEPGRLGLPSPFTNVLAILIMEEKKEEKRGEKRRPEAEAPIRRVSNLGEE